MSNDEKDQVPKKRGLHISKEGVVLFTKSGNIITNINKIKPKKQEKKKHPNKQDNNKVYREFIKTARRWPKYVGMGYRDFLYVSKGDYEKWKNNIPCNIEESDSFSDSSSDSDEMDW